MDYKQAEHRFRELKVRRERGELAESEFRLQVAKLMFRDDQGVFWMLDAGSGAWFCNRGEGWEPEQPRPPQAAEGGSSTLGRRRRRLLTLVLALVTLVALSAVLALQRWPFGLLSPPRATPTPGVQVKIASPADGGQVALGQEVAVESTIQAASGLQVVDHIELQVNGQIVESHPVRSKVQPGQTSLPVSQPWLPTVVDQYQLTVMAYSAQGEALGGAAIVVNVAEASDDGLPEPACTPDATFMADVTLPARTAFRPGTQVEKVWQVRNSGTCAWGVGYQLVRVQGPALNAPDTVSVPPIAAGGSADLSVTFQAPSQAGIYSSTWQLQSPDGVSFGPLLSLSIEVESQAAESLAPNTPTGLQATVTEDGKAVRLTWQDLSDNEDAFRVYREDVEASIGLAPANASLFTDGSVICGNTYRYAIVAFNAAGASPLSEVAEVALPPCTPADAPPSLVLTVVPTQAIASGAITLIFQATDDVAVSQVVVRGEQTGDAQLDAGRTVACSDATCAASWLVTPTVEISTTLTFVGTARDSSGQDSEPARVQVLVLPSEKR
jgi:hypothetical protein